MIAAWIVGGVIGALVAVYMIHAVIHNVTLSSARFFHDLPRVRPTDARWRFSVPKFTRAAALQFPLLLLLLAALWLAHLAYSSRDQRDQIGFWIWLDTSGSMSTLQADGTRIAAAATLIRRIAEEVERGAESVPVCYNLSTFNMATSTAQSFRDAQGLLQQVESIEVAPLGTDLSILLSAMTQLTNTATLTPDCPATHIAVVTDQSIPDWYTRLANQMTTLRFFWFGVGEPVANAGFTDITAARNPLTGQVHEMTVEMVSYVEVSANARLQMFAPDMTLLAEQEVRWNPTAQAGIWTASSVFTAQAPGLYQFTLLSPLDGYLFDNVAAALVESGEAISVDWQMEDHTLRQRLGWVQETSRPHLRVTTWPPAGDTAVDTTVPTLFVGSYQDIHPERTPIYFFYEASPLLANLSLDVAETMAVPTTVLPADFIRVLYTSDDGLWLAARETPPAAYVPALPPTGDSSQELFATTAFFNAVRWLLQERPLPPFYDLTSPDAPEISGNRVALHKEEGNTLLSVENANLDELAALQPAQSVQRQSPFWPPLLALVALLLCLERALAAWGGNRWR